jgi:RpiR family transcriptional regulator, carbohydrate utilization regulator
MSGTDSRRPGAAGLLDVIATALPGLRRSEQKVADVVLADPRRAVFLSVAGLAHLAGVSEPTVMRFCAAIGCDGFLGFKIDLAGSLALGIPATQSTISAGDDVASLVGKVFDYSITSLDHVRRVLDRAAVARSIEILATAESILFLGLGASGIVAQDAEQKFPLFGVPCSAPVDTHQQFIAASLAGPGRAVVAISNTGRSASIIDAATAARANGATVIGISGAASPLLECCDPAIVVEALDNTDFYTPTISRLAQLVIVDVLATGVALRRDDTYIERLRVMKARLTRMREGRHADA